MHTQDCTIQVQAAGEEDSSLSSKKSKNSRGFTLVEILIVLALIGIVAGLAMSTLTGTFEGGKIKAAQTWVDTTGPAYINSYLALAGEYPKSLSDLQNPPSGIPPFVKKAKDLNDPWGQPYQYLLEGSTFKLWTNRDGKEISNKDTSN